MSLLFARLVHWERDPTLIGSLCRRWTWTAQEEEKEEEEEEAEVPISDKCHYIACLPSVRPSLLFLSAPPHTQAGPRTRSPERRNVDSVGHLGLTDRRPARARTKHGATVNWRSFSPRHQEGQRQTTISAPSPQRCTAYAAWTE